MLTPPRYNKKKEKSGKKREKQRNASMHIPNRTPTTSSHSNKTKGELRNIGPSVVTSLTFVAFYIGPKTVFHHATKHAVR